MGLLRALIVVIAAAGTVGGALTGFGGEMLFDGPSGWVLVGHMATAPLMFAGFAGVAVVWGAAHRFDRPWPGGGDGRRGVGSAVVLKAAFWIMLLMALGSMGTMLAAMTPLFGYVGQDMLRVWHEWCGIGLLAAGAVYAVSWALRRRGGARS